MNSVPASTAAGPASGSERTAPAPEQVIGSYRLHWRHRKPRPGRYLRSTRAHTYRIVDAQLRAHSAPGRPEHEVYRLRVEQVPAAAIPTEAVVLELVWDPRDPRELRADCAGAGFCARCREGSRDADDERPPD